MPAIPPPNTKAAPTFLSFCCVMSYSSSNDLNGQSCGLIPPTKGLSRQEAKFGTGALMPQDAHQGNFFQVIQTQGYGVDGQAG